MDGEGRSQTDYYTIRVSNPSSSGEAYFIVSAIAASTCGTDLSSYTCNIALTPLIQPA